MGIGPQRGKRVSVPSFIPRATLSSLENSFGLGGGGGAVVARVMLWRLLRVIGQGIVMLGMVCSMTIVTRCCHTRN